MLMAQAALSHLVSMQNVGKAAGFVAMGVAAGALMSALAVDVTEVAVMGAGGPCLALSLFVVGWGSSKLGSWRWAEWRSWARVSLVALVSLDLG